MSWGALYFYYKCPVCSKLLNMQLILSQNMERILEKCPTCENEGVYIKEGARTLDDLLYEEIE